MHWLKEKELYMFLLIMKFVNGEIVMTEFAKVHGEGKANIGCSSIAGRSADYLAVAWNESNLCTKLDWTWGSSPSYTTGSTYYEKKRVVQIYETPLVLGGGMKLPITFRAGSYITMSIEFTVDDFTSGTIRLMDMFEETFSVYDNVPETVMINMLLRPSNNDVYFKSWSGGWINHGGASPYHFTVRSTPYNITFKALTDDMQVLFDGVEKIRYSHRTAPENARQLLFPDVGLLLHRIEFVGV